MNVSEVLEALRTLSPEERAKVRALLDSLLDTPSSPDEQAQARLRAAGLLGETRRRATTGRTRHTPVEIKGRPLSETVIESRGLN